jgi:hypothetical protein
VAREHNDGYDGDVEKAKLDMITIDCLSLIKGMI